MSALDPDLAAYFASLGTLFPPLPADPSNAVERLPAAVELGRRLFEDARLSANGAVSCLYQATELLLGNVAPISSGHALTMEQR